MDRLSGFAVLTGLFLLTAHALPWPVNVEQPKSSASRQPIAPLSPAVLVETYCAGCHSSGRSKIDLDGLVDLKSLQRNRPTWKKVARYLRSEEMPPRGQPKPSAEEREFLIRWIEDGTRQDTAEMSGAGALLARRLTRAEYLNTLRDLVGVRLQLSADFPTDEWVWEPWHDVPTLPAQYREKYVAAAERILDEALVTIAEVTPSTLPAGQKRIFLPWPAGATRAEYAREILTVFARRAYRRSLEPGEARKLYTIFEATELSGKDFKSALKVALKEVLTSPHFLYRMQVRPGESTPGAVPPRQQFVLGSRLAFFLWSSMPDDELQTQARRGVLHVNVQRQARRMLKDVKAQGLMEGFAASWLELGKLANGDPALQQAMRKETELFVAHIMREDRSVLDFLDADFTFVNERLASHYGIAGIEGDAWQRVTLEGTNRGGLLNQASILSLTSQNAMTSPVKRGKWVLENLLGTPPQPPPSGLLNALEDARNGSGPGTARQLLEKHRANPSCAHCHEKMDAFGFALENFDAAGSWRTHEYGRPIDPAVTLPSGEVLDGPNQLRAYLKTQAGDFVRCLSEKLLSYALGRTLDEEDRQALAHIPEVAAKNDYRFSTVLLEVVSSSAFLDGLRFEKPIDYAFRPTTSKSYLPFPGHSWR